MAVPLPPLQLSSSQAQEGRFSSPVNTGSRTFNFSSKKTLADVVADPLVWVGAIVVLVLIKKLR